MGQMCRRRVIVSLTIEWISRRDIVLSLSIRRICREDDINKAVYMSTFTVNSLLDRNVGSQRSFGHRRPYPPVVVVSSPLVLLFRSEIQDRVYPILRPAFFNVIFPIHSSLLLN